MSTWGAMRVRISDELHRKDSSDNPIDNIAIQREMVSTIRTARNERFDFNEGTFSFTMTIDEDEYGDETAEGAGAGYPDDLLRFDNVFIISGNNRYRLVERPLNWLRESKSSTNYSGYPYAWGFHHDVLIVFPPPNQAFTCEGDYVKDIGTPYYTYSGGTWTFKQPDDTDMADSYTSDWFTGEAEELIRAGTKLRMYTNYLKNKEQAMEMAAEYRSILQTMRGRYESYSLPNMTMPSFF